MQKDEIWERLIELLMDMHNSEIIFGKRAGKRYATTCHIADHLIAHGVTIQRWIPVTERKPELIPNNAGTAYSEAVIVLTAGRKVTTAVWDGTDFICPMAFWDAWGEEITHWTPVLLPLPEVPKE